MDPTSKTMALAAKITDRVPTSLVSITMDLISISMAFTPTTTLPSTIIALSPTIISLTLKITHILIIISGLIMPLVTIVLLVLTRMLIPTLIQNPSVLLVVTIQLSQTVSDLDYIPRFFPCTRFKFCC